METEFDDLEDSSYYCPNCGDAVAMILGNRDAVCFCDYCGEALIPSRDLEDFEVEEVPPIDEGIQFNGSKW